MKVLLWLIIVVMQGELAHSASYYLSPSGNNANAGTSSGAPWLTFSYALAHSNCGDTLLLADGTYTASTSGELLITKTCTVDAPYTVQSINQRLAHLSSTGASTIISVKGSSYITIDGLHFSSADNSCCSGNNYVDVEVVSSNSGATGTASHHITLKNLLGQYNNRYQNAAMIRVAYSHDVLIEDTELYDYHRHGAVLAANTSNSIIRRLYCNGRSRADISGGFPSGFTTTADSCAYEYPSGGTIPNSGNIMENVVCENVGTCVGIEGISGPSGTQIKGIVSRNDNTAVWLRARGSGSDTKQPVNTIVQDVVIVTPLNVGLRLSGNKNTTVQNAMILDPQNAQYPFYTEVESTFNGDGTVSFAGSNILGTSGSIGLNITEQTAWSCTNCKAFGNTTNYSPSSSANYSPDTTPTASDPQLGTCLVWRPDGSAAQSNNWGADVLYRYHDGVLTTIPFWDPTTGELPHGSSVSTVNDLSGTSAFDVHTRLNINMNGCTFPASYATGGTPSDPATYVSSTGSNSSSHIHNVGVGTNLLLVFVNLRAISATVGLVSSVTACGGESLTKVTGGEITSSPSYYRTEAWHKFSPTAGSCSINVTTTGTVDALTTTSIEIPSAGAITDAAASTALTSTPSVTVLTTDTDTIYDSVSGRKDVTITAGPDQTFTTSTSHGSVDLRGVTSTQSGAAGGVMSWVAGGASYETQVVVSIAANPVGPAPTATVTLSRYQFFSTYGTESGAAALSALNQTASIAPNGEFRLRTELTAGVDVTTEFGAALYCQKNGAGYSRVINTTGAHGIRLYGGGIVPNLSASLSKTTQRFTPSGSFTTGAIIRDALSTFIVPAMAVGNKTELEFVVAATLSVGDTVTCQVRRDDGSQLEAYTVTPTFTTVAPSASFGF